MTELGTITLTPDGATPTQETDNATLELKPLSDEITNAMDWKSPGLKLSVAEEDCVVKPGRAATGTRTAGVAAIPTVT
jgi:hypothetical protein